MLRTLSQLAGAATVLVSGASSFAAGSIFLSGHDAIWHGAFNLAVTGIEYARNGNTEPFLFVESKTAPVPGGNSHEAPNLAGYLGYVPADYVVMDAADLAGLSNFRTALESYSAIVVASDHGGMLTSDELGFLNANTPAIIDYLNDGGGIAAFAESDSGGLLGATPRFGFLPFVVSSDTLNEVEDGNTVTAFGASLGLVDGDVNGNFSHNIFLPGSGLNAVDLRDGNPEEILSLAFRGTGITEDGVGPVPEGSTVLAGIVLAGVVIARRARRQAASS